jgi:Co/Zn/Cd efflux system component
MLLYSNRIFETVCFNTSQMLLPSIYIFFSDRFLEVEEIHDPQLILIVGAIGLGINGIGLLLFHGKCIAVEKTQNDDEKMSSNKLIPIANRARP